MVGLGGITTELFRDVVYRPAPVGAAEAEAMLGELKAAPLLRGFRGAPKADVAALSKLISEVSVLAARLQDQVSEIELNPVLVHAEGQGVDDRRCAGGAARNSSGRRPGRRPSGPVPRVVAATRVSLRDTDALPAWPHSQRDGRLTAP